ncbi:hypothetical protein BJX99DRAFT_228325 [Aspergillus californicus]
MSDYGPPYGFAFRSNNTCPSESKKCSNNWGTWWVCCPENTHCGSGGESGGICCPTDSDCSAPILKDPHCANNATWDLYNADGYFCCESGTYGFEATNLMSGGESVGGVGCADDYPSGQYNSVLNVVNYGSGSDPASSTAAASSTATTTSSTTPTPSDSATDSSTDSSSDSSSTNTGAIAGGVVGGVAGLVLILALLWFFLRRRKQQAVAGGVPLHAGPDMSGPPTAGYGAFAPVKQSGSESAELESNHHYMAELDGGSQAHELPGNPNVR